MYAGGTSGPLARKDGKHALGLLDSEEGDLPLLPEPFSGWPSAGAPCGVSSGARAELHRPCTPTASLLQGDPPQPPSSPSLSTHNKGKGGSVTLRETKFTNSRTKN